MLETLNRADNGASESGTAFRVTAKAKSDARPEYWPENAEGFVTDLTVVADDEQQARELATQWLAALEPACDLRCDIRVVSAQTALDGDKRPRGVARVDTLRNYFRD
jgi:hypothetical protein